MNKEADFILIEISKQWKLPREYLLMILQITPDEKKQFIEVFDHISSFFLNISGQIEWVKKPWLNEKDSILALMKENPKRIKEFNEQLRRIINP